VSLAAALGLFLWIAGPFIVRPLAAFGGAERAEADERCKLLALPFHSSFFKGP